MTRKKNKAKYIISLVVPAILTYVLFKFGVINVAKIIQEGNTFQFNIISFSAIIGGFLFTGISILISIIDKERIHRLWVNHYLDNLYWSAITGIITNILSIVSALIFVFCIGCNNFVTHIIVFEVFTILASLIEFSWCVKKLFSVLQKLKEA